MNQTFLLIRPFQGPSTCDSRIDDFVPTCYMHSCQSYSVLVQMWSQWGGVVTLLTAETWYNWGSRGFEPSRYCTRTYHHIRFPRLSPICMLQCFVSLFIHPGTMFCFSRLSVSVIADSRDRTQGTKRECCVAPPWQGQTGTYVISYFLKIDVETTE